MRASGQSRIHFHDAVKLPAFLDGKTKKKVPENVCDQLCFKTKLKIKCKV